MVRHFGELIARALNVCRTRKAGVAPGELCDERKMETIDSLRDALADALRTYRQLRPQLFDALVELQHIPGGPWSITYKRDPSEGDPSIPPKSRMQASTKAKLELDGYPNLNFVNLATVFTERETYAPLQDFAITKDEKPVAPDSSAAGVGLRIGLILKTMLNAAKTFAGCAHAVREAVRNGRITSDARPILVMDERFPWFPYWPRFTPDKGIYDAELAKEAPLLDAAEMAITLLAESHGTSMASAAFLPVTESNSKAEATAPAPTQPTSPAIGPIPDASPVARPVCNADFTMVNWYGKEYNFALGVQSSAVKALWEEWEKSGLGLHQDTIRNAIDAERDNFRMDTAFRNHPAFGTMIQRCGDGKYKLARPTPKPISATSKTKKKRQNRS